MKRSIRHGLLVLCTLCGPSIGHPHMFIDVSVKFMLSDSGLAGFYVYWDIDEMNSAWLVEDYDRNKNGLYEQEEQKLLHDEAFINTAKYGYFMSLSSGPDPVDTLRVEKFSALIKGSARVVYSFYVPCGLAVGEHAEKRLTLFFADPTIYVAFDLKKELIQTASHDRIAGDISYRKKEYSEAIVLTLKRRPP